MVAFNKPNYIVMLKKYFLLLLFITSLTSQAQGEASKWYFGNFAGLDFSSGTAVPLTDMPKNSNLNLNSEEGCTTISSSSGNLLFYTNGKLVWNKNHQIMRNGQNLGGDQSSTQSAIVVPHPSIDTQYYIFTVDEHNYNYNGFSYSIVDMSLNNGLGDVGQKNINLLPHCSEKVTAVQGDECSTYWIITYASNNPQSNDNYNSFYAFKVDENGLNTTPVISYFTNNIPNSDGRGYLKLNADGTKLAIANQGLSTNGLQLYDFNNVSGIVSNPITLSLFDADYNYTGYEPYGLEFSLSGRYLYVTTTLSGNNASNSQLWQYDMENVSVGTSGHIISRDATFRGALQMAPDGKIYRSLSTNYDRGSSYVGAILNPEGHLTAANYAHNYINIDPESEGRTSRQGLPPFIQSMFLNKINLINPGSASIETSLNLCQGESFTLSIQEFPNATYSWYLNDILVANNTRTFTVSTSGNVRAEIISPNFKCPIKGEVDVYVGKNPVIVTPPANIKLCTENTTQPFTVDFNSQTAAILGNQSTTDFKVSYFNSEEDAIAHTNQLTLPLQLTAERQQLIYAKIHDITNPKCNKIASFELDFKYGRSISSIQPIVVCDTAEDGSDTNGKVSITLTDFTATVFGNQDLTDFVYSYHATRNNANANINPIATYYNNTPFNDVIYMRLHHVNTPDCYTVLEQQIKVNALPFVGVLEFDICGINNVATQINLSNTAAFIQNINANYSVEFFNNTQDAALDANALTSVVSTTRSTENYVVKITDRTTNCAKIQALNFNIFFGDAAPILYRVCDTDIDGISSIDLSQFSTQTNTEYQYYATLEDAQLERNPLPLRYTNTTAFEQIVYQKQTVNGNCISLKTLKIQVNPIPHIVSNNTIHPICIDVQNTIELRADLNPIQNVNYTYLWNTGATTPSINVSEVGLYEVVITTDKGCQDTAFFEVTLSESAILDQIIIEDLTYFTSVKVLVKPTNVALEYSMDQINGTYQESNVFFNVSPGFHTVYVRDINRCSTQAIEIAVLGAPNFFTPNYDGINDTWNLTGISKDFYANTEVHIYDKYGKLLKSFMPINGGWDGTYNSRPVPATDYWFVIELENGRSYKSHFSLKR